jgi:hypothetical protein
MATAHSLLPHTPTFTKAALATDNTPALAWVQRRSPTSIKANAWLLRQLAQQCRNKHVSLDPCFTPGVTNTLADFCSRSWSLPDDAFLCELHPFPCTALLDSCPPDACPAIKDELRAIAASAAMGLSTSRQNSQQNTWSLWESFCATLAQDPTFQHCEDPIPLLRLFAHQYRAGVVAPSGAQVRSRTVEGALRAVGQTLASLGLPDPRLQPSGHLDIRLQRQLSAYKKMDDPPTRVKPVPFPLIVQTINSNKLFHTPFADAVANMLLLGFFFLLRPGEYADTNNPNSSPFRLCDVHMLINHQRLNTFHAPEHALRQATAVALEFSTQKNGVRGELVGLGRSGHATLCPVHVLVNRILHLRLHRAPPTTPLYAFFDGTRWATITAHTLTTALCTSATVDGGTSGITASDISARSLRSSGAMALLCAQVDTYVIRLLGRWRSDEMMRYLHVQALPIIAPLATQMLLRGAFPLLPSQPHPQPNGHMGGR